MDSQHRQELKTPEALKWTRQINQAIHGNFFETYGNHLLIGVSVVALALAAWIYWSKTDYNTRARAWSGFDSAVEDDLVDVVKRNEGTKAAEWAAVKLARIRIDEGVNKVFSDREAAVAKLETCQKALTELIDKASVPEVKEQASFLLAECESAIGKPENLDKAQALYEQFAKNYPKSVLAKPAAERAANLQKKTVRDFYAWIVEKNPKPEEPKLPKDTGETGFGPDLLPQGAPFNPHADLPPATPPAEMPPETPPATPPTEKPVDKPAETPPAAEKPADEPAKPAAEPAQPAESKPAGEPSKEPAEPATAKPDDAKPADEPAKPAGTPPAEDAPQTP